MRRAVKLSIKHLSTSKKESIRCLIREYRAATNFYIKSLLTERGKLDKETLERLPDNCTRLSQRYRSQALKQALGVVVGTKRAAKAQKIAHGKKLVFKGSATLDAKFATIIENPRLKDFDLLLKLSTLDKGKRIAIPLKATKVLRKWLSKPGAKIIQGCSIKEDQIVIWVEFPNPPEKKKGDIIGLDVGYNKLFALSDGSTDGRDVKKVCQKVARCVSGSKGKKRAMDHRDNYLYQMVNRIPFEKIKTLVIEDLSDMKRGKNKKRGKSFRKALSPWTYRRVLERISQRCQENGVQLVTVDPRNTSRKCPDCGSVNKDNRNNERFRCISCGRTGDADIVGAENILHKGLALLMGNLESPMPCKRLNCHV